MNQLVSCIIPAYNAERYIGEALESILAQTHSPVEIIVVDDGSTDNTEQAVRSVCENAIFERQANSGPAAARNRGIMKATGSFIALLDADDRWLPVKLEQQLKELETKPEIECVLARVGLFWEGLQNEEAAFRANNREELTGFADSNMLVRRNVFDRVGPFNASLPHAAAVEWFERAANAGMKIATLSDILVEHRMHVDSYSRTRRDDSHAEFLQFIKGSMDRKRAKQDPGAAAPE